MARPPQPTDRRRPRPAQGPRGASPVTVGVIVLAVIARRLTYFGFTKDIPFTHGYRLKAVVRVGQLDPRRTRRSASRASTSARSRRSSARPATEHVDRRRWRSTGQGAADPQGRDGEDPAAHLPRGQLLRRPAAGHARRRRRSNRRRHASRSPRPPAPVQLDQVLTALQSRHRARTCRSRSTGYGNGLTYKPTAADDAAAGPRRPRQDGGPVAQRGLRRTRRPRCKDTAIVNDALLGTAAARPLAADRRASAQVTEGLGRNERQLQDLITNFNTHDGGDCVARRRTCARRSACCRPTLETADARVRQPQRRVPDHARVRPRDPAGRPRDAGDDRRRPSPGSPRPAARLAGRAAAGSSTSSARRRATSRKVDRRELDAAAAGRPRLQVHRRDVDPADRRHRHPGRPPHHRRRELQGVLVRDGRARRRGPELRRQRPVRALPDRRRHQTVSLDAAATSTLFGNAPGQAAGDAPGLHGPAPALPARGGLLHAEAARPQRRRDGPSDPAVQTSPATTLPARRRRLAASGALGDARRRASGRRPARGRADEARDPEVLEDFAAVVVLALLGLSRRLHPRPPALLPARLGAGDRQGLRRLQGRILHRAVGHAGPGADHPGRGRRRRRDRARSSSSTARRSHHDEVRKKYTPIYQDATALLRPKTGLNDMIVELDPGTPTAGKAPEGWTIPIDRTLPNVNADEVPAALDGDTRDYLQLLVGGAGQASGPTASSSRRRSSASSRRPRPRPAQRRAREAPARPSRRSDPQLPAAGRRARRQGQPARPRSSTPPTGCSAPSPGRTRTSRRPCRCCRPRCRPRTPRWPRPTSSPRCSARRSATCAPAPARSGPRCSRRGRSCARPRRSSRTSCGPFARRRSPSVEGAAARQRETSPRSRRAWTTTLKVVN